MNRGGAIATPGKTPLKDGGNTGEMGKATKSGRKVKRPAHFDDSPDSKKAGSGLEDSSPKQRSVPESTKKSARKTILKGGDDSPKKNGDSELDVPKKSARKTLMPQDARDKEPDQATRTNSRRTITVTQKEESPEPESIKKSARKTLLKSAVKNSSLEQSTPKKEKSETESPKMSAKKNETTGEETPAGPGVSRTGRKIKVPAHLKEFEDVLVATSQKETLEKSSARKSLAPVAKKQEEEEKPAPKTPGRGRSMAATRKASETEQEETKVLTKTPRRGKSLAAKMDEEDPLALPLCSDVVTSNKVDQSVKTPLRAVIELVKVTDHVPKTPKRGKSLAPESNKSPVLEEKLPVKTPSKRGKSIAAIASKVPTPEKASQTPKIALIVDDSAEPVSRSGRKIKPKKYFGEFEEDETVPIVAKVSSPIKTVVKSSPVTKKSPPKQASPVKRHKETEKTDESPNKKPKLDPKPSTDGTKQMKLAPKTTLEETKRIDDISPNTEERQITKRGVNDHHHAKVETNPTDESTEQASEKISKKDPVEKKHVEEKPKRSRSMALATSSPEKKTEPEKPAALQEKSKRSRKTLPAPSEDADDEKPKAPKTPVAARRMTTAMVTTEDVGSSRSGRKIKPKKFFGEAEEEEIKSAKAKANVSSGPVNGGGRGKRKTLAKEQEEESDELKRDAVEKAEEKPKTETEDRPSRDEIMTMVGAVDPVEEMMEELHMETQDQPKQEDGYEENEQPDAALVGDAAAEISDNNLHAMLDEPEPVDEDTAAEQPVLAEEIEPIEPVADETHQESDPVEEEESTNPKPETLDSVPEENFREISVPQTSPAPCPPTEEVPNDPAPLPEDPPLIDPSVTEDQQATIEQAEPTEEELQNPPEQDPEPMSEQIAELPEPTSDVPEQLFSTEDEDAAHEQNNSIPMDEQALQPAEISANSNFSEALLVEDDPVEQPTPATADDSKAQNYESVEFLELSNTSATATEQVIDEIPPESTDEHQQPEMQQQQNRITTPELEDDLDNTEVPPMDDIDDEKEEELLKGAPEPTDESFLEQDRDNESIIVIPDTPKQPKELIEELELNDKSPIPHTSQVTVARVELPASPVMIMKELVPSTPRTPESKTCKASSCSPDKPDDQEQANVPHDDVIEISDSPNVMIKSKLVDSKPDIATSTPLRMGSKKSAKDRLIENSRKRSLSVSDAEIVKKHVTFHSPANSTMLVDTLDERLKKKNESASKPSQGHRKRSLSEHKDPRMAANDGPKPAKISKLPNFKNIHQQQFNRMESIEEFHNRKIQRAKEILANSAVKSPAATALIRSDHPPHQKSSSVPPKSPFKGGNGKPTSSSSKSSIARPQMIPKPTELHKPLSDAERQEKRQKQFQAAFKPKTDASATGTDKDTPDGARRIIEQSRHKQNQILKGVRTNKRFELLMKFRDAQE